MKLYGIIDNNSNRLIAFSTASINIPDCYVISGLDHDDSLIGKKYNISENSWEEVLDVNLEENKFYSDYAKSLNRV